MSCKTQTRTLRRCPTGTWRRRRCWPARTRRRRRRTGARSCGGRAGARCCRGRAGTQSCCDGCRPLSGRCCRRRRCCRRGHNRLLALTVRRQHAVPAARSEQQTGRTQAEVGDAISALIVPVVASRMSHRQNVGNVRTIYGVVDICW